MFPNDINAEVSALRALAGTGLAPCLERVISTAEGHCLVYGHVDGTPLTAKLSTVAGTLRRLHRIAPPDGLRRLPRQPEAILLLGDRIASDLSAPHRARLHATRPPLPRADMGLPVFVHGDAVPANILYDGESICLIDWQCPAIGDATEDLATFLSPAMQSVYAGAPLEPQAETEFLEAYGDAAATARYRELAPLFHWRMAAHCLWKAARGDPDYAEAAELELSRLATGE